MTKYIGLKEQELLEEAVGLLKETGIDCEAKSAMQWIIEEQADDLASQQIEMNDEVKNNFKNHLLLALENEEYNGEGLLNDDIIQEVYNNTREQFDIIDSIIEEE